MRFKLLVTLILILVDTYPLVAQDSRALGKSIYSSNLYSHKLYQAGIKKGKIPLGKSHYSGLLYERGTATLKEGTYTTTDYSTAEKLRVETFTLSPWLGQSLYKGLKKEDKEYLQLPYKGEKGNIFYQEKEKRSEVKVKEEKVTNPFLRR